MRQKEEVVRRAEEEGARRAEEGAKRAEERRTEQWARFFLVLIVVFIHLFWQVRAELGAEIN
jgi:hypothetical protein